MTVHEMNIRKNTWWVSTDRRLFVITEIHIYLNEESKEWEPETVGLLDALSDLIVHRPWKEICELYDNKSLKKPTAAIIEEYSTKKLIKL